MKGRRSLIGAPRYTTNYADRHGRWRSEFRRGTVRIPLPGPIFSDAYWEAYRTAFADSEAGRTLAEPATGPERATPGTVNAGFIAYTNSTNFRNELADSTQRWHFNILSHWRDQWGDRRLAHLRPQDIRKAVDAYGNTPAQAAKFLKALRRMLRYCAEHGLLEHDPSAGIKAPRYKETSYRPWTDDELARFRRRHAYGSNPRTALELFLGTAQRPSDVVDMGRQHLRGDALHVKQKKTGWENDIAFQTRELPEALARIPPGQLSFIENAKGKPYTVDSFRNQFRKWCNQAGLPKDCHAHGLRDTVLTGLANKGATTHEIQAVSGHLTLAEVQRYTKRADQARLARSAALKNQTGTQIAEPESGFGKNAS